MTEEPETAVSHSMPHASQESRVLLPDTKSFGPNTIRRTRISKTGM